MSDAKERRKTGLLASLGWSGWSKSCSFFGITEGEALLDTYNCALKARILLQGHMYVFEKHVCFYSRVFAHVTKISLSFGEVIGIQKAKNFGLPNSIEVRAAGESFFFTSYLFRDDAFNLLMKQWRANSKYAKLFHGEDTPTIRMYPTVGEVKSEAAGSTRNEPAMESGARLEVDGSRRIPRWQDLGWETTGHNAPDAPAGMELLGSADLPCHPTEAFYFIFYGNNGNYEKYHHLNGCKDVTLGSWKDGKEGGKTREASFMAPTRSKIGPSLASCHQHQVCHVYMGNHIVYCTDQEMRGIPYGEYFKVATRWDLFGSGEAENDRCQVQIRVEVVFSRNTVWKHNIIHGVRAESLRFFSAWEQMIREGLSPAEVMQAVDEEDSAADININNVPPQYKGDFERLLKLRREGTWNFDYHMRLKNASLWALGPAKQIPLLEKIKQWWHHLLAFDETRLDGGLCERSDKAAKNHWSRVIVIMLACLIASVLVRQAFLLDTVGLPSSYVEAKVRRLQHELRELEERRYMIKMTLEQLQRR